MLNIGWFSSMRDPEALDLLGAVMQATREGRINGKICWVFCNQFPTETTTRLMPLLDGNGIPFSCCPSDGFMSELRERNIGEWRRLYDEAILRSLQDLEKPDIVVLAGFMLIVSAVLCEHFDIVNLHPALPDGPKGTWQQVTQKIVDKRAKETGTMLHLVTPELDAGPALTFCRVGVEGCSFKEVRRRQFEQEIPLLILTLAGLADGTIKIGDHPRDLTVEVEAFLGKKMP